MRAIYENPEKQRAWSDYGKALVSAGGVAGVRGKTLLNWLSHYHVNEDFEDFAISASATQNVRGNGEYFPAYYHDNAPLPFHLFGIDSAPEFLTSIFIHTSEGQHKDGAGALVYVADGSCDHEHTWPTLRYILCHDGAYDLEDLPESPSDIATVLRHAPRLRSMALEGSWLALSSLDHKTLREVSIQAAAPIEGMRRVLLADAPQLERLILGPAAVDPKAVDGCGMPALAHLSLRGLEQADLVVEALSASSYSQQLRILELEESDLSDEGLLALARHAGDWAHLLLVRVHACVKLSADGIERARHMLAEHRPSAFIDVGQAARGRAERQLPFSLRPAGTPHSLERMAPWAWPDPPVPPTGQHTRDMDHWERQLCSANPKYVDAILAQDPLSGSVQRLFQWIVQRPVGLDLLRYATTRPATPLSVNALWTPFFPADPSRANVLLELHPSFEEQYPAELVGAFARLFDPQWPVPSFPDALREKCRTWLARVRDDVSEYLVLDTVYLLDGLDAAEAFAASHPSTEDRMNQIRSGLAAVNGQAISQASDEEEEQGAELEAMLLRLPLQDVDKRALRELHLRAPRRARRVTSTIASQPNHPLRSEAHRHLRYADFDVLAEALGRADVHLVAPALLEGSAWANLPSLLCEAGVAAHDMMMHKREFGDERPKHPVYLNLLRSICPTLRAFDFDEGFDNDSAFRGTLPLVPWRREGAASNALDAECGPMVLLASDGERGFHSWLTTNEGDTDFPMAFALAIIEEMGGKERFYQTDDDMIICLTPEQRQILIDADIFSPLSGDIGRPWSLKSRTA
ncbi:MAG: hypothetical protein AB8H86_18570 [Polyangiales bacterium]